MAMWAAEGSDFSPFSHNHWVLAVPSMAAPRTSACPVAVCEQTTAINKPQKTSRTLYQNHQATEVNPLSR